MSFVKPSANKITIPKNPQPTPKNFIKVNFSSFVVKWDNIKAIKGPTANTIAVVLEDIYCWPQGIREKGITLFTKAAMNKIFKVLKSFGKDKFLIKISGRKNKAAINILENAIKTKEYDFKAISIEIKVPAQIAAKNRSLI